MGASRFWRKIVLSGGLLLAVAAGAQSASPAQAEKRVALVIGNSAYKVVPPLANPRNDAVDMVAALKSLGFEVIEGLDLDKAAFDRKIRDFAVSLSGADVGVFFYAGHALQVSGVNYLAPVDASLTTAMALDFDMVRLDLVQRIMEHEAKTNILFLDACRDNPLARNLARALGTRSAAIGQGLAAAESGLGTLISYSTQPGNVARDGTGRNSPFTGPLVRSISTSSEDVVSILTEVRNQVLAATSDSQVPWENHALRAKFYFRAPVPPVVAAPRPPVSEAAQTWEQIKDTTNIAALQAFIKSFSETPQRFLALDRIEVLRKAQPRAASPDTGQDPARIALIVTNQKYSLKELELKNTHLDGNVLKAALEAVGFKVWIKQDIPNRGALEQAISEHAARLANAGSGAVGFFYYSGHGAADGPNGGNYLIPTEAQLTNAAQLPLVALSIETITSALANAGGKMNFVVFDACRNVPLQRANKVTFKGFAPYREERGLLIAYATEPGNVAQDENLYARTLAEEIVKPGLEAGSVFRAVSRRVFDATGRKQQPDLLDRRLDDFVFKAEFPASGPQIARATPEAAGAGAQPTAPVQPPPSVPTTPALRSPQECKLEARHAIVDDAGRVTVSLTSNCLLETISIRYRDWTFVRRPPPNSKQYQLVFDLFQGPAPLTFDAGGGAVATVSPSVPSTQSVIKLALVWDAPVDLNLHVLQFAARPGEANDVWAGNPRQLADARSGQTGFLSFSEPGQHLQVYTLIKSNSQRTGTLQLRVDYLSRGAHAVEPYCGTSSLASVDYKIVQFESGKSEDRPRSRSTNRKPCGAALSDDERYESPVSMVKF